MTQPAPTEAVNDVLLLVAIKGLVPREELERRIEACGCDPLEELVERGLLACDSGYVYQTEDGDQALTASLQARLDVADRRALEDFYEVFEDLDRELKSAATEWQMHRHGDDADRFVAAIEQWYVVDDRLAEALQHNSVAMRTVGRMADALRSARNRFQSGDQEAFTGVDDTSYHSTWFLMHELLLRTVDRQRAE